MPPNDDVERPRASSAAERQKSIVSMTEFEGMDEYTALQKYILFYRDTRTNPHAEKATKKKAWWQFWKSGSPTAATPIEDAGAVPDERKSTPLISIPPALDAMHAALHHAASPACECGLCCGRPHASGGWMRRRPSSSYPSASANPRLCCICGGANQGQPTSVQRQGSTKLPPAVQHMRDEHHDPSEQSY